MSHRDGRAGLALLEARLEAFQAYAELVHAQELAADRGDLAEIERLSDRRFELQRRLECGGDLAPDVESDPTPDITGGPTAPPGRPLAPPRTDGERPTLSVMDGGVAERERTSRRLEQVQNETRRVLLATAEAHERFVERLGNMRDETRDDVDGMGRRRSGIESYVGRKSEGRRGLNIRF